MKRFWFNLVFIAAFLWAVPVFALGLVDRKCSSCHTMHNSQGGAIMTSFGDGPYGGLLRKDCVGCHTGTNSSGSDPFVLGTSDPTSSSLAGGNFWWVDDDGGVADNKGHNVVGIAGSDANHVLTPPGGTAMSSQLTCGGSNGCHGTTDTTSDVRAIKKGHHYNESGKLATAGSVAASYRFLDGIKGYEDPDWEFTVASTDHNEYYGSDRSGLADSTEDTGTISSLCGRCHGDYHSSASEVSSGNNMTSPWIRHPTDFDMYNVVSKSDYSGVSTTYNPLTPLGRSGTYWTNLASPPASTVMSSAGDAVVMCITCHRAHGSPNASLMRWNYRGWPTDTSQNGCQQCHTTKD